MAEQKEDSFCTDGLAEVIGLSLLKKKIEGRQAIKAYWGTAPTGEPHLAYLLPLLKVREMVKAGWHVTVLVADVHSYMDEGAEACSNVQQRAAYYKYLIASILERLGVAPGEYDIVLGSEYQFDRKYCIDLFKFTSMVGVRDAKKASSDVVKQSKNPRLSNLIYPLMQVLDETVLEADVQLGGMDQRKIFMMSWDWVEKLGHTRTTYFMTPIIPSLTYGKLYVNEKKQMLSKYAKEIEEGKIDEVELERRLKEHLKKRAKMSSSDPNGKLAFTDTDEEIARKVRKAFCLDQDERLELNSLLCLLKYVVFPFFETFEIKREEKYGGDKKYDSFVQFMDDWRSGAIVGADLKPNLSNYLITLVAPIREKIEQRPILRSQAYPQKNPKK